MDEKLGFTDAEAYDRFMGGWSRAVGTTFLDWLGLPAGQAWLDVGCGSGALTDLLVDRCSPASVAGVDPAPTQAEYTRSRYAGHAVPVDVRVAGAEELPFGDDSFDAAAMALVIFFVPQPDRAVAEMARVVRPGGTVATYGWDLTGHGFPYAAVEAELAALGLVVPRPASPTAAEPEELRGSWTRAGLEGVSVRTIEVEHTYPDFAAYWDTVLVGPMVGAAARHMPPDEQAALARRVEERLGADAWGAVTVRARANAVRGTVP